MKKYIFLFIFAVTLVSIVVVYKPNLRTITTDSGWDSSYSSSSSSSSSSDSFSDNDGGGSSNTPDTLFINMNNIQIIIIEVVVSTAVLIMIGKLSHNWKLAIIASIIRIIPFLPLELYNDGRWLMLSLFSYIPLAMIILIILYYKTSKAKTELVQKLLIECSDEELQKTGISNREEFKNELYNIFVDIQMAWMNFDYDALSKLCSNELFSRYKSQLEVLKSKHGKNIMSDFTPVKIIINSVAVNNNMILVNLFLDVIFYDYVIDTITNQVTRGTKNKKLNNMYHLQYTKKIDPIDTCPSCGSKLTELKDSKCPYCNSTIINNNQNFVLSNKEIIWL